MSFKEIILSSFLNFLLPYLLRNFPWSQDYEFGWGGGKKYYAAPSGGNQLQKIADIKHVTIM
jgi:hypothetical protein